MGLKTSVWGKTKRPWGWEVRIDVIDGSRVSNEMAQFDHDPSEVEVAAVAASTMAAVQSRWNEAVVKGPEVSKSDTDAVLLAKVATLERRVVALEKELAAAVAIIAITATEEPLEKP